MSNIFVNIYSFISTNFQSIYNFLSISIFSVIITQVLSHRFTEIRESRKYYTENYQKLYAPIITYIFQFLEMNTHFRRVHDVDIRNEHHIYEKIMKHISSNLVYASPLIIRSYNNLEYYTFSSSSMASPDQFYPSPWFVFLMRDIVNESAYISKVIGKGDIDRTKSNPFTKYQFYYTLWSKLFDLRLSIPNAQQIMSVKYMFEEDKINDKITKKLSKLRNKNIDYVINFCAINLIDDNETRRNFLNQTKNIDSNNYSSLDEYYYSDGVKEYLIQTYNINPFVINKTCILRIDQSDLLYYINNIKIFETYKPNDYPFLTGLVCLDGDTYFVSSDYLDEILNNGII